MKALLDRLASFGPNIPETRLLLREIIHRYSGIAQEAREARNFLDALRDRPGVPPEVYREAAEIASRIDDVLPPTETLAAPEGAWRRQ